MPIGRWKGDLAPLIGANRPIGQILSESTCHLTSYRSLVGPICYAISTLYIESESVKELAVSDVLHLSSHQEP